MSARLLLSASTNGLRSSISEQPEVAERCGRCCAGSRPAPARAGSPISSTVLNPLATAPCWSARNRDDLDPADTSRPRWSWRAVSSHRLIAAYICRVPGSVSTATCFADSTVTFGRPN